MRRHLALSSSVSQQIRTITGVAPVLHLARPSQTEAQRQAQVAKNTKVAIDMVRRFKGPAPEAYERETALSFEDIQKEVESLLGSAEKLRKPVRDDQPMDKLTIMERTLRHALCQYMKDAGQYDFELFEKWLAYTPEDEVRLGALKREVETKASLDAFRKRRAAEGGSDALAPAWNLQEEYDAVIDREFIEEKRARYDAIGSNTTARDENAVTKVLQEYIAPVQEKRLDEMSELLDKFLPVLAREAIMQRLTVKHLEGQLSVWRYLDWNPEVRDRAEVECDTYCHQWWTPFEEKHIHSIRMRTRNEVIDGMEAKQAKLAAEAAKSSSGAATTGGADAATARRAKLLQEIIHLQQRLGKKDDEVEKSDDGEGKKKSAVVDDSEQYKVDASVVDSVGLLGLDDITQTA